MFGPSRLQHHMGGCCNTLDCEGFTLVCVVLLICQRFHPYFTVLQGPDGGLLKYLAVKEKGENGKGIQCYPSIGKIYILSQ